MNVNVRSIYLSTNVLLPYFLEKSRPGVFINIASTAAIRPRPNLCWCVNSSSLLSHYPRRVKLSKWRHWLLPLTCSRTPSVVRQRFRLLFCHALDAANPRPRYNASKAAVNNATKSMAVEYAPKGIRFVSVCPVVAAGTNL